MNAVIQICVGCKDADRARGEGGGPALAAAMARLISDAGLQAHARIETYPCLGRCARKGRMSLSAPGRWSWLFEAIDPALDGPALVTFLREWREAPCGLVPKELRPARLRGKMLGRVPPVAPP